MASIVYNNAKAEWMRGSLAWASGDGFKVLLLGTGYTPDPDHSYVSDVVNFETGVFGYEGGHGGSGRKTLTSRSVTVDNSLDLVSLDAADSVWNGLGAATIGGAVVFLERNADADSWLIAHLDFTDTLLVTGQEITLQWPNSGIIICS